MRRLGNALGLCSRSVRLVCLMLSGRPAHAEKMHGCLAKKEAKMKTLSSIGSITAFAFLFLFTPPDVKAEPFADLYLGAATTADGETTVSAGGVAISGTTEYKSSLTGGGRLGLWLNQYFGLGLDLLYFNSNATAGAKTGNFGVAFDLMARYPLLVKEDMPNGQMQPYLTVGPAIFSSTLELPGFTEGKAASVGVKLGGGLKYLLTKNIGLFGEYRFTYFEPSHDIAAGFVTGEVTQQLQTNHFVGGISFHF